VVLGDNFFHPKSFLCDLIAYHVSEKADATLGVAKVKDVTRHGIIMSSGDKLVDIVEKPLPEDAPSKLGAIGIYVFEPEIFDAIRRTKPGHKGEYQLTDSIKVMIDMGRRVHYREIDGIHIDVGTPKDLMLANEWYIRNQEFD
jgi:UDP-N-acetylglucosamine diphosphorylase / glucose-1-phosphate thymidylyltransferase / UDP-N-acetylgalactosamine diphosphorylase / glucosamine-1-phosphate N-acetyltransferase / galactosamine-1-phosphate N-acetyltransferase